MASKKGEPVEVTVDLGTVVDEDAASKLFNRLLQIVREQKPNKDKTNGTKSKSKAE